MSFMPDKRLGFLTGRWTLSHHCIECFKLVLKTRTHTNGQGKLCSADASGYMVYYTGRFQDFCLSTGLCATS